MAEEFWTTYLPPSKLGKIEFFLRKQAAGLAGPIQSADDIVEDLHLKIWANAVDVCIRNITRRFSDGPTFFCLIASELPNALIVKFDDFQCVVISTVLPDACLGLALRMTTSTSYLEYIETGIPLAELGIPPSQTRDESLKKLFEPNDADTSQPSIDVATAFLYISAYFLCSHELGHLALGHLDRQDKSISAMSEMGQGSSPNRLQKRTKEWDADVFASAATVWYLGQLSGQEGWEKVFVTPKQSLRYFFSTAYHFFTIMDFCYPGGRGRTDRTHPEPLVRISLMLIALLVKLESWGIKSADGVFDDAREAVRAFEITLQELGGGNMSRSEATRLQSQAESDLDEIVEEFQSLKTSLNRIRLTDLYFAKGL